MNLRPKSVKRSPLLLLVLLTLALPLLAGFAPSRQDGLAVDLVASAGYEGYFRQGQWLAVRAELTNRGASLDGALRVRSGGIGGLAETIYQTPVILAEGVHKQVFLYVSPDTVTQRLQVEVVDRSGEIAGRANVRLQLANRSDVLIAVVTDSLLGAVDLTALTPGIGEAHQVNWQVADIPPLADALAGLDVLMFHDVDTGTLSADQLDAIQMWVLQGGHLIVAGGEFWQRTTAAFGDLLPVTLEGTQPIETLEPLADYLRADAEPLETGTTLTRATVRPGARALANGEGVPLLVRGAHGGGTVDFLAVDPQTEPLRSWGDLERLWYTLLASAGQQPSWLSGHESWSMAREATLTSSNTTLPTFAQLCGFLALYIVLIGPANYLLLKRLNRREWAWATIPVLIAIFSVLAYTVGFNLRGSVPSVNRLATVMVWPDSDQAHVNALVGVQSPRRIAYNIAAAEGGTLRTLPDVGTGLSVAVTVTEGQRTVVEDVPIDAGMTASFAVRSSAPAPALEGQAEWLLSTSQAPRLTGSVTNTLDVPLEDAVILVKGASRYLGTLAPGDTRTFNISLGPQDPGPLALGQADWLQTVTTSAWGYAGRAWCFTPEGLELTMADMMRSEAFPCEISGLGDEQQKVRQRYRLLGALVVDYDISGGRGAGVYLAGWTDEVPLDVELVNRTNEEEDTALWMLSLPVSVTSAASQVVVPPGLTTWTVVRSGDARAAIDVSPTGFQLTGTERAVFEFMPLPEMRLVQVDALTIQFAAQGALRLDVWNWQDDAWMQVEVDPAANEMTLSDAAAFVGPENAVRVRVVLEDPTLFNEVDYLKVAYRGALVAAQTEQG
ncbi:DUF7408 domain-containing protein [Aggregatilinea lenta]|uniref:DUF7408 domain-containing protein n=1 Tax=Aggregatilinea lenta TaxID=913108 RepID=UPI0013C32F8A|nr:hypothetical protein [Aggregatilinea lenta]